MSPEVEIPRVFDCWSYWLKEAGLCDGIADVDLIEMQVFGCQPKDVNPLTSPQEYADECTRLRSEYGTAYRGYFDERDMAFPCRYTVVTSQAIKKSTIALSCLRWIACDSSTWSTRPTRRLRMSFTPWACCRRAAAAVPAARLAPSCEPDALNVPACVTYRNSRKEDWKILKGPLSS